MLHGIPDNNNKSGQIPAPFNVRSGAYYQNPENWGSGVNHKLQKKIHGSFFRRMRFLTRKVNCGNIVLT